MADTRQLRSSSTSTVPSSPVVNNKRPRRASNARHPNDDIQQRERKRALDRKAQRASREKTKSHIAHLEQMVQILSEENGNAATRELMLEVERLQAEVERLRKIIDGIRSALGPGTEGLDAGGESSTVLRTGARLKSELTRHQEGHVDSKDSVSTPQGLVLPTDPEQSSNGSTIEESELAEPCDMDIEVLPTISETSLARLPRSPETTVSILNWSDSWDEETIVVDTKIPPYHGDRPYSVPSPLTNSIPTPSTPQYLPCEMWQKANSIYAKIFQFNQQRVAMANKAEPGSLVKVVKYGWGSLSLQERANPIFVILKEVDQQLFWDLDPVTKIANLYKSWLLLKYYFNRDRQNLEKMAAWQRPVTSQKTNQHPIPIDFFPWPALRDRLVRHHNYYFATSDFSVHYRQHFKFRWPFSFNDTYRYDSATDKYTISPLFERYHRDMRCWSMEQRFFDKFPEFVGKITAYGGEGWDRSRNHGHQKPVDVPEILRRFGKREGESCGNHNGDGLESCGGGGGGEGYGFLDKDVMDLFDEYPELM